MPTSKARSGCAFANLSTPVPLGIAAVKFWTRQKFKGCNALKKRVNPTRVPIEQKESVRWIDNLREATALLGDDLYAHNPFCRWAQLHACHFIFTCLRESHRATYEYLDLLESRDIRRVRAKKKDKSGHAETWFASM